MAKLVKPDAVVWKGDSSLPRECQGIRVLGAPIGTPAWRSVGAEVTRTGNVVHADSHGAGHTSLLAPPLDVRANSGELLVAHDSTGPDSAVC